MEKLIERGIPAGYVLHYRFDLLEHEEIKNAKALYSELKQRLSPERTYLFLDEIQEVPDFDKYCLDWFMCFKREKKAKGTTLFNGICKVSSLSQ